jgi:membrane-bound lytic murein transglycosylase D
MMIRAGSALLVPRAAHVSKDVTEHMADNGQLSLSPEVVLKRTLHKAGKNESVATVAKRYRVSPASVAEWNQVSASAAFKLGQQVVVFLPAATRVASASTSGTARAKGKLAQGSKKSAKRRGVQVAKR